MAFESCIDRIRDLHRVQRRTLAKLVAGREERQPTIVGHARIPSDPTDQDLVAPRRLDRFGEPATVGIVHDFEPGGGREDRAGRVDVDRPIEFEMDRLAVRPQHGDADAGRRDQQSGRVENPPGLGLELPLLPVHAVGIDFGIVTEDVEDALPPEPFRGNRPARDPGPRLGV